MRTFVSALLVAVAALGAVTAEASATGIDLVRLEAVEASGLPRSYVTITIAIPEPLRDAHEVAFEVRLTGLTDVVGRTEGVLRPSQQSRVILTLRVPAEALVGLLDVADVVFRADDGVEFVIPVLLRVPAVRGFLATGTREFRGLSSGDRVDLLYAVHNYGNAPDTLTYELTAPLGWSARPAGRRRVIVPARGRIELPASVAVPASANLGDHMVGVKIVSATNASRAQELATVLGVTGSAGRGAPGVTLRPVVAAAASFEGSISFVGATLDGQIAEGVHLSARYAPPTRASGYLNQGLSSVGAMMMPPSANLTGRTWDLALGSVGASGTDLTGAYLFGEGASFRYDGESSKAHAIVARPASSSSARGRTIAAGYSRAISVGQLGGSIARIEEDGVLSAGRELTAVGAEFASNPIGTLVATGALAYRSSNVASGLGAVAGLSHEREGERANIRVVHAPGGSGSFARAANEVQFSGSRSMNERWTVDLFALQTRDEGSVFRRMQSRTLTFGNRYQLRRTTTVFARLQSTTFDAATATTTIGGFGSSEHSLAAGSDWKVGEVQLSAEFEAGVVGRRSDLLDGRSSESSARQAGLRIDANVELDGIGHVSGGAAGELTEVGVGFPAKSWTFNGRWQSVPMLLLSRPTRMNARIGYQQFGALAPMVTVGAGASLALPSGTDLNLSVERNPFFRDASGRVPTTLAMSLTASARVFTPAAKGPESVVFEDLNNNGRRDANERGVAGVGVSRGDARAVSDREGRYRLPKSARGRTIVNVATVPVGMVTHPNLGRDGLEVRDIPLLPTGSLTVSLTLVADADGRLPTADLTSAVVLLRDSTGFEWVGRRTSDSTASFSGIPTGAYTLRVDVSQVREPLRVDDVPVLLQAHDESSLVVPLRGRVIRYTVPPGRSGRSGGRGPSTDTERK